MLSVMSKRETRQGKNMLKASKLATLNVHDALWYSFISHLNFSSGKMPQEVSVVILQRHYDDYYKRFP
mgnify:CR=1 FL=1